jgi:AsmA protein
MRAWLRYSLYVLGAIVLLLALGTAWLLHSFDGERAKRIAADWLRTNHQRELVIDGPVTLKLWPQPALTLKAARLSEAGQPAQPFARIADAALSLRLEPLWRHREFEIDKVSARGVKLELRRDAQGRSNIDDFLGLATGNSPPQPGGRPFVLESLDLADAELQVDDALRGLRGRLALQRLTLGRFGPGLSSPLHLQAQAALSQPPLSASLSLDARLEMLPATAPGAVPQLRLDHAVLHLKGSGGGIDGLELALQAARTQLDYGDAATAADTRLRFDDLQLQFSGSRLGWQVDTCLLYTSPSPRDH